MATYYRWNRYTIDVEENNSKVFYMGQTIFSFSGDFYSTRNRLYIYIGGTLNSKTGNVEFSSNERSDYYYYGNDDRWYDGLVRYTDGYFTIVKNDDPGITSDGGLVTNVVYRSSSITELDNTLNTVGITVAVSRYSNNNSPVNKITFSVGPGTSQGYVYDVNSSAYPNGGVSGDYYYDQRTTVTSPTAPSNITTPNPITTPSITVSWTAATSNTNYPVNLYALSYSVNGSSSWTVAGTTADTSLEVDIPAGTTSIQFRVRARDSNGQWGSYSTSSTAIPVYLAPTLTVPQMVMQGQQATVNWTAIEGADSYTLQRKSSADADWTQVYSGTALTFSETVGTWTSVQYRVQAVFDGTPGGWATSAEIPVVSASALVISGQDGDLGTLVNDVPYSISTDTGNQITATITANGAVIFSGNVGNSVADVIPVLDLINGQGTIVIEASVTASSGPVSAVRTWTYTKTMMTFPNAGSIAELTKNGKVMWPETLAEAVRIPGGKTLDQVMGFPAQVYAGSYVGTGTFGGDNPTEITFPFVPDLWGVIGVYLESSECFYVQGGSKGSGYQLWLIPWEMQHFRGDTSVTADMMTASYDGSTISFYNANSTDQWNYEGRIYYFIGIKIG